MKNMKRWIPALLLLLVSSMPARGQEPQLGCTEDDADYLTCFQRVLTEAEGSEQAEAVGEEVAAKATPEESPEVANGLRNFLPSFLGALGLGDLSQDDGTLTFTVNPELLHWGASQLSLRTILREATVFDPLVQALPEEIREERRDSLAEGLNKDFGDVEASLAWNLENERFGRDFRPHRTLFSELHGQLVSRAAATAGTNAGQRLTQLLVKFPEISLQGSVKGIRNQQPEPARLFEMALVEAAVEAAQRQLALVDLTKTTGFFQVTDLINNKPQIHVTGAYHYRDDLAGQNEWSINGTYEYSFHNLNRWNNWCDQEQKKNLKLKKLDCLAQYLAEHEGALKRSPRFTFAAEFGRTSPFDLALPEDDFAFHLDEIEKRIGSLTYGQYLSLDKEGNQITRIDVEAKYEDVTGDPLRNERFVSTATLTQRLPNNTSASVTLVYADKPEYLGTVDKELSARLGLRFKMDQP